MAKSLKAQMEEHTRLFLNEVQDLIKTSTMSDLDSKLTEASINFIKSEDGEIKVIIESKDNEEKVGNIISDIMQVKPAK
jgi:hypothetical protein